MKEFKKEKDKESKVIKKEMDKKEEYIKLLAKECEKLKKVNRELLR